MKALLLSTILAAASATKVLLPLYVWPAEGAWDRVYKSIEANSQLTFQIIINPNSGPGNSIPGDSREYIAGVTRLNSYSNVQLFGYVHCNYGTNSGNEINQNVTQWNSWNTNPKTSIDGIFYDEIPNKEGSSEGVEFLASLVKTAKIVFGDRPCSSIFNPGAPPQHVELYDSADYVVVFESEASSYSDAVLTKHIPSGKAGQSSILIYNFGGQDHDGQLGSWLQSMSSAGVASANILNTVYSEANSDDEPAGIGSVASILSACGVQSAAKPANGTGSNASKLALSGISSAPGTSSISESLYNPHDKDSDHAKDEDHEKYEHRQDHD